MLDVKETEPHLKSIKSRNVKKGEEINSKRIMRKDSEIDED